MKMQKSGLKTSAVTGMKMGGKTSAKKMQDGGPSKKGSYIKRTTTTMTKKSPDSMSELPTKKMSPVKSNKPTKMMYGGKTSKMKKGM